MRLPRRLTVAASIVLASAPALSASDTPRDELNVSLRTVLLLIFAAMLGGIVSWISKVRAGTVGASSLMFLVGELCTSAFAGFCCYLLCDYANLPLKLTILFTGISGHMGTKAITAFEKYVESRWPASEQGPTA